ncbi:MAG: dihydroxy-acid dehydratase [Pseudomonadota bacterium]
MVEDEDRSIGKYYGIWPTLAGLLLAGGIIYAMFALADGFA